MVVRSAVKGGHVEVYDMLAQASDTVDVMYFDVNSLYPHCGMEGRFPTGPGIHLKGPKMMERLRYDPEKICFLYEDPERKGEWQECDGVAQILIGIEPHQRQLDQYPFLPLRIREKGDHHRSFRVSCQTCLRLKQKTLCTHTMAQRRFRETYMLEEIAFALSLGYTLYTFEEALVYPQLDYIFQDFMQILASKKIKYGNVPPSYTDRLEEYCDEINAAMKFSHPEDVLCPSKLEANQFQCSFIKSCINIGKTWGVGASMGLPIDLSSYSDWKKSTNQQSDVGRVCLL